MIAHDTDARPATGHASGGPGGIDRDRAPSRSAGAAMGQVDPMERRSASPSSASARSRATSMFRRLRRPRRRTRRDRRSQCLDRRTLPHFSNARRVARDGPPIDAVALCTPPQVRTRRRRPALAGRQACACWKSRRARPSARSTPLIAVATARRHARCSRPGIRALRLPSNRRGRCSPSREIKSVTINWKEDVRVWHPGQAWIWEPGGFGVFDPGINALSILTRILPRPVFVTAPISSFPPIARRRSRPRLSLADADRPADHGRIRLPPDRPADLGHPIETDRGPLMLSAGGARLIDGGEALVDAAKAEYPRLYRRFVELTSNGACDVDLSPLQLVADAFLLGRRRDVEAFEDWHDRCQACRARLLAICRDGGCVERIILRGAERLRGRGSSPMARCCNRCLCLIATAAATTSCSAMTNSRAISRSENSSARPSAAMPIASPARVSCSTARWCNSPPITVRKRSMAGSTASTGSSGGSSTSRTAEPGVTLAYTSADGEEGYPGRLEVRVTYRVTGPTELSVELRRRRLIVPTVVNLTNHSFFNLDGARRAARSLITGSRSPPIISLRLMPTAIPLPEPPRAVAGTPFDFRSRTRSVHGSATTMRNCGTAAATITISAYDGARRSCGSPHGSSAESDECSNS